MKPLTRQCYRCKKMKTIHEFSTYCWERERASQRLCCRCCATGRGTEYGAMGKAKRVFRSINKDLERMEKSHDQYCREAKKAELQRLLEMRAERLKTMAGG
jgi:hypothetical protein